MTFNIFMDYKPIKETVALQQIKLNYGNNKIWIPTDSYLFKLKSEGVELLKTAPSHTSDICPREIIYMIL